MARLSIREAWAADWQPRDRRPTELWAGDYVITHRPLTITGKFKPNRSRHFIRPLQSLRNTATREVNVLKPVRDGGTLIGDIDFLWAVANDSDPYVCIFQDDAIAKDHAETRIWPMMRSIKAIMAKMPADANKARTQEILFNDGNPAYFWGPSMNNLQSKGFRRLRAEELWKWKKGILDELKGRRGDFEKLGIDKLFCNSQGGFAIDQAAEENSDWFHQYYSGRLNEWFVPCLACGAYQLPAFNAEREDRSRYGLIWDEIKNDRGLFIVSQCLETIRFKCRCCGHEHTDCTATQVQWNERGEYYVPCQSASVIRVDDETDPEESETNAGVLETVPMRPPDDGSWIPARDTPDAEIESFRWLGTITYNWRSLVKQFLVAQNRAAHGDKSAKVKFIQKKLPDFFDPRVDDDYERLPAVEIVSDAESEKPIEEDGIIFPHKHLMVDVQLRELWALVDAWSDRGDDITLYAAKLDSFEEVFDLQKRFKIHPSNVGIDINYQLRRQEVARACCLHGELLKDEEGDESWFQWIAYRGSDKAEFPYDPPRGPRRMLPYIVRPYHIDPTPGTTDPDLIARLMHPDGTKMYCKEYVWSNPTIKDILEARRDSKATAIRSLIRKGDWNDVYSRHMHGEKWDYRVTRTKHVRFERVRTSADHLRDGKCMSIVHAMRRGYLNFEPAEEKPADAPSQEPKDSE